MTFDQILEQYESTIRIIEIPQSDNGDCDYDVSHLNIKFNIDDKQFDPTKGTKKVEAASINLLQDLFDQYGWEFKNATNGLKYGGMLLVEHHQQKTLQDEQIPSGLLISKSGYWWYGIDDVGFIVLKKEFLDWCYEFNLKHNLVKDKLIQSQIRNRGFALHIPIQLLPYLMNKYREEKS